VADNLRGLAEEEDTDGDRKITINDPMADFVSVYLNGLLYQYETDVAGLLEQEI
jgi:Neutral trehalase Ca2+ binding domain